jgi:hypothetical protein
MQIFYTTKFLIMLQEKFLEILFIKIMNQLINSITIFIKPDKKQITKNLFLNTFKNLIFDIISLKLNNKIYNTNQFKNLYSLNYKENKLLLYQFLSTNIKFYINKNK